MPTTRSKTKNISSKKSSSKKSSSKKSSSKKSSSKKSSSKAVPSRLTKKIPTKREKTYLKDLLKEHIGVDPITDLIIEQMNLENNRATFAMNEYVKISLSDETIENKPDLIKLNNLLGNVIMAVDIDTLSNVKTVKKAMLNELNFKKIYVIFTIVNKEKHIVFLFYNDIEKLDSDKKTIINTYNRLIRKKNISDNEKEIIQELKTYKIIKDLQNIQKHITNHLVNNMDNLFTYRQHITEFINKL